MKVNNKKLIILLAVSILILAGFAGCTSTQDTYQVNEVPSETTVEYSLSQDEVDNVAQSIEISDTDNAVNEETSSNAVSSEMQFADGVYTGAADGFGPNLTVEVTVSNGLISEIKVLSHNEQREEFYGLPMQLIPEEIIQTQSLTVDTVSGATYTSIGLQNAVIDALSNAVTSGELPAEIEMPANSGHKHGR